jgi:hypothetical protein
MQQLWFHYFFILELELPDMKRASPTLVQARVSNDNFAGIGLKRAVKMDQDRPHVLLPEGDESAKVRWET